MKGVKLSDFIVPMSALDTYPTNLDIFGKGGIHSVDTIPNRDAMVDQMKLNPSYSVEQLLGRVGAQMVGDIQEKIGSNVSPENAPLTIYIKTRGKGGKTTTLIDTGVMRNSINYKIVDK